MKGQNNLPNRRGEKQGEKPALKVGSSKIKKKQIKKKK